MHALWGVRRSVEGGGIDACALKKVNGVFALPGGTSILDVLPFGAEADVFCHCCNDFGSSIFAGLPFLPILGFGIFHLGASSIRMVFHG